MARLYKTGWKAVAIENDTDFHNIPYLTSYAATAADTNVCTYIGGKAIPLKKISGGDYALPYIESRTAVDSGSFILEGKRLQVARTEAGYYNLVARSDSVNTTQTHATIIGNVAIGLNSDNALAVVKVGESDDITDIETIQLGSRKLSVGKLNNKWYPLISTNDNMASTVLASSPLSYFRFSETSGTDAIDEQDYAEATYVGTFTLEADGINTSNTAVSLAGGEIRVSSPAFGFSGNISVEAWVYVDSTVNQAIFHHWDGQGLSLEILNNKLMWYLSTSVEGDVNITATTNFPTGQWVHVAGVWDGSQLNAYINGSIINTPATATGTRVLSENIFTIGGRSDGNGGPLLGKIDEVAVYNSALSQAEIIEHINAR